MIKVYETNSDNTARFALGDYETTPLVIFGVNCSTATDEKLDTTVTKVKRFSEIKGFDGWLMFNLYPQRATKPEDMHLSMRIEWHQKNLAVIEKYLSQIKKSTIWAAWGQTIEAREYLQNCLADIVRTAAKFEPRWVHAGELTKSGHPRHPSRMAYSAKLFDFNVEEYNQLLSRG
jgi:hypothetical protein